MVTLTATDDEGLSGVGTASVGVVDTISPSVSMTNLPSRSALQDGVTFNASSADSGSEVNSMTFSIRKDNGALGTPVGFEDLLGMFNSDRGNWELLFDTMQLPDGYINVI